MTSTRPYLLRAIYEWIVDNGLTPHLPQQHMLLASTAHGATPPPPYRAPPSFDQAYRIVHGGTTQFQQAM